MYLQIFASLFFTSIAVGSTQAAAQTIDLRLVQANNCVSCHQVEQKRIGPAFRLIAERFAGQPDAADYLAAAIRSGGRGRWGAVPMPAQPQVSPQDAQAIAAWILSLENKGKATP